jgi:hypothetical protein
MLLLLKLLETVVKSLNTLGTLKQTSLGEKLATGLGYTVVWLVKVLLHP